MARRAVMLALLVVCAGCTAAVSSTTTTRSEATTSTSTTATTPATESTLEDMIGRWNLVEYTVNDVTSSVEVGVNAAEKPWVMLTDDNLNGSLGCNSFEGTGVGYELSARRLVPGEVAVTDMLCAAEGVMEIEDTFLDFVWAELEIRFEAGEMTWTLGDAEMVFIR